MADKESRTEDPTDKRKAEAREQGNIAKSQDLVSWTALFVGLNVLQSTLTKGAHYLESLMNQVGVLIADPDEKKALHFMVTSIEGAMMVVAPLALTYLAVAMALHVFQVRFVFAKKALKPDFKRLNPAKGIKRLFSKHSYVEAGKQVLKMLVLGYVAYATLWNTLIHLGQNGPYAIDALLIVTLGAVSSFLKYVALIGVAIGAADYLYQRKRIGGELKMSKEEVKQESKQSEGNPEMKGKIRQKQRAMSRNRMMASIKDADVVIVNPVHVAVALQYDISKGAPRVVAKGAGFVAEKIREVADEHKIPLIQDIPLARTLHRTCEVDEEIPMEMFEAVAQLLAFVFGLKNRGTAHGFHKMPGTPDLAEYERDEARKAAAAERLADAAALIDA